MRERYDDDCGGILMDRHRHVPGKKSEKSSSRRASSEEEQVRRSQTGDRREKVFFPTGQRRECRDTAGMSSRDPR